MAIAGYSGTALLKKLGVKPRMRVLIINKPNDYYELLEINISDQLCKKNEIPDLIHLFVKNTKEFEVEMKKLKPVCKQNPTIIIWISWYKKAAKIKTDIKEDVIRNYNPSIRIDFVSNGLQLMEILPNFLPDLLFLDLEMPYKNGLECLLDIRNNNRLNHLPVIVFSSTTRQANIQTAYEVGAHLFQIKLLTNNPKKRVGLIGYGLEIVDNIPLQVEPNPHNEKYLQTKRDKLGHEI